MYGTVQLQSASPHSAATLSYMVKELLNFSALIHAQLHHLLAIVIVLMSFSLLVHAQLQHLSLMVIV